MSTPTKASKYRLSPGSVKDAFADENAVPSHGKDKSRTRTQALQADVLFAASDNPARKPPGAENANGDNNVKVLVRIRPCNSSERKSGLGTVVEQTSSSSLVVRGAGDAGIGKDDCDKGRGTPVKDPSSVPSHEFTFDHVLGPESSQNQVYMHAGSSMVENCLAGYNSSLFAYGQTGSGKVSRPQYKPV
eukprot:jgi/Mesvir1/4080/Mv11445-RA.1